MKFIAKAVVGLVVIALLAVGAAAYLGFLPGQTRTIDRSQPALLKSVEDLGQFHGAAGNFEVILDIEKDKSWVPGFLSGERSLFVAGGTVNAYVDFAKIGKGDLKRSLDGSSVTIRLPEAELDKPNLDQERTYLYDQDKGLTNLIADAFSTEDQQELYVKAEEKLAKAAEQADLTDTATENTKLMLRSMFASMDMTVTFAE